MVVVGEKQSSRNERKHSHRAVIGPRGGDFVRCSFLAGEFTRFAVAGSTINLMVAREFTLKALQKALSAASITTAENLSAHGQPLYTLQGKVVTAAVARTPRKTRRKR